MSTFKKFSIKLGLGLLLAIFVFTFSNPTTFAAPLRFTASNVSSIKPVPMKVITKNIVITNGPKSVSLSIDQAPSDGSGNIIVSYILKKTNGETIPDGNKYCYGSHGPGYGTTGSVTFPKVPIGEYTLYIRSVNSELINANVQAYY